MRIQWDSMELLPEIFLMGISWEIFDLRDAVGVIQPLIPETAPP